MGHLFRCLEIIKKFTYADIFFVCGSKKVSVQFPENVKYINLPVLKIENENFVVVKYLVRDYFLVIFAMRLLI